jgi:hypothetical protein
MQFKKQEEELETNELLSMFSQHPSFNFASPTTVTFPLTTDKKMAREETSDMANSCHTVPVSSTLDSEMRRPIDFSKFLEDMQNPAAMPLLHIIKR